jgi:VanZ family protein
LNEPTPLHRGFRLGIWLAWMCVIFYFSTKTWGGAQTESSLDRLLTLYAQPLRELLTTSGMGELNHIIRKLAHFTEYAILTSLGYWGLAKGMGRSPDVALRITLLVSILFAISDEFHQRFVPGRTSLVMDVFIDCFGAAIAAFILRQWVVGRIQSEPREQPEA